jgi:hypothetical protein
VVLRGLPALLLLGACAPSPEGRALAYLAHEARDWPVKNRCYSCHNNGDAVRALYEARRLSVPADLALVEDTRRFLLRPEAWQDNGPKGEFSDKKLASLQFAAALAAAADAGLPGTEAALPAAAELLRSEQEPDGSWKVDADDFPGGPVTYGRTLATVFARHVLLRAPPDRFGAAAARAGDWLRRQRPVRVLEAAAVLLGVPDTPHREHCLDLLRRGQTKDGGWGPYVESAPEAFDTAIVLLALADEPGMAERVKRGRAWLIARQDGEGGWRETTRPAGAESYAHRISTTGWATLALLRTR